MKVKVKVITPVHIGSGQSISPSGYFIDREKGDFNFLNMDSLFCDPGFSRYQKEFIGEVAYVRYIEKIIKDYNLLKKHVLYSIPATQEARTGNRIEVKLFIKSAGRPYLPGSSLKGAIVTALIYYALNELYAAGKEEEIKKLLIEGSKKNEKTNKQLINLAYDFLKKKHQSTPSKYGKIEDNSYYSSGGQESRFMHLLDVSDSSYLKAQNVLKVEQCRVQGAKRGGQIPVLFETLKERVEAEFEIRNISCKLGETQILQICHDFYQKVAAADGVKINAEPNLLRIGQGATAFGTSLLILAEELGLKDRYGVKPPRTRKRLTEGKETKALGFVQLTELK
ncbi:MAG: type III-A CRISPR-associated RAMP protein Csm5 [Candidatus Aminicenantes bacterium]|nr:type III-A CRISPR-associated RAMP protein Csm5 [Candidatus Aminicenantes bacterium]